MTLQLYLSFYLSFLLTFILTILRASCDKQNNLKSMLNNIFKVNETSSAKANTTNLVAVSKI